MHNRKIALLAVITASVLLTGVAMLAATGNRVHGGSSSSIDSLRLMLQARNLPEQVIENLFWEEIAMRATLAAAGWH
jgi:hypothetical protein